MPGLVGFAAKNPNEGEPLTKMISRLLHQSSYQQTIINTNIGHFGCVHLGHFDHSIIATSADESIGVVLDGWIWNVEDLSTNYVDPAEYCLDAYIKNGPEFVTTLNGEFDILIWDDRSDSIFLLNDRFGLRPLQYLELGDKLYFAPEAKAILEGSKVTPKIDDQMVLNFLSLGRAYLGERTFFQGIRVLPPASILKWQDGRVSNSCYWDYQYEPLDVVSDEFIDELVMAFRKGVTRRIRPNLRYGLTMSGGLDSRVVASILAPASDYQALGFSFGLENCDEVNIAKTVAERVKMRWRFMPLGPEDFIKNASEGIRITEGLDIFVQSYGMSVYPELAKDADIAFTGLGLDLSLGGTYIGPELLDKDVNEECALQFIESKCTYFNREQVGILFGSNEYANEASEMLHSLWKPSGKQSIIDEADRFALRYRCSRVIFMRQAWQRMFLEDASPTFDVDFVNLILKIPAKDRVDHHVYKRFMERLCPELMDITYQRTLLPPVVPIRYWKQGAKIEAEREQLYEDIFRESKGEISIPYTRYSTNYTQWLREDPGWRKWADDLLVSNNSLLPELGLNKEFIVQLLEQHQSAAADHRQRLLQLLTLELFLREYFNG